jgi:hypothetical protein
MSATVQQLAEAVNGAATGKQLDLIRCGQDHSRSAGAVAFARGPSHLASRGGQFP